MDSLIKEIYDIFKMKVKFEYKSYGIHGYLTIILIENNIEKIIQALTIDEKVDNIDTLVDEYRKIILVICNKYILKN